MVQASGVVLDFGGVGLFRCGSEHDRRLAASPIQEDQRRGRKTLFFLAVKGASSATQN